MNEKLQEFFIQEENSRNLEKQKQRNQHLVDLGLYEKVYSGKQECSEEYPFIDGEGNTYKKVGIDVTDEEYRKICEYAPLENTEPSHANTLSKALNVLAVLLIIAGVIIGLALGTQEIESEYYYSRTVFSFALALPYWAGGIISGAIFLAFAEIIRLLDKISKK